MVRLAGRRRVGQALTGEVKLPSGGGGAAARAAAGPRRRIGRAWSRPHGGEAVQGVHRALAAAQFGQAVRHRVAGHRGGLLGGLG
jgi:hypothetical protein